MRDGDRYETYLSQCLEHLRRQETSVWVLAPIVSAPHSLFTEDVRKGALITDKLNELVEAFLKTDYSHIWLIDCDIMVPPDALDTLIRLDVDVASGIYPYHNDGRVMMAGMLGPPPRYGLKFRFREDLAGKVWGGNELVAAGSGCLLVKRRVFEPFHPSLKPIRFYWSPANYGSDLWFWHEAQAYGFTCRIHGDVYCGHLPEHPLEDKYDAF